MDIAGSQKIVTKTFLEPCGKCDPCVTKSANISAILQHLKKYLDVFQIKILITIYIS